MTALSGPSGHLSLRERVMVHSFVERVPHAPPLGELSAKLTERANLPLEGKGDREAVDEVYDRQFPLCSALLRLYGRRMFFFRKSGQAGSGLVVRILHLISHLPCGKCQLPLEGKLRARVFPLPHSSWRVQR